MTIIFQVIINGILFGSMYGVAAIGLSLICGTMRVLYFAQGSFVIVFAYLSYWLFTLFGIDVYLSLLIAVPIAFLFGLGQFYVLFKEAATLELKEVSLLIAIGLVWVVENLMLNIWTANPRFAATSYAGLTLRMGEINISFARLMALVVAVVTAFIVHTFLKKTMVGTAVRAATEDTEATALLGIKASWVMGVSFAIGLGLAGVGGVVMASVYSFDPTYGFDFTIKALVALTLGGIGQVWGALCAGLLLGVVESLGAYFIGAGWSDALSYLVFILVLIFKPEGLFSRRKR